MFQMYVSQQPVYQCVCVHLLQCLSSPTYEGEDRGITEAIILVHNYASSTPEVSVSCDTVVTSYHLHLHVKMVGLVTLVLQLGHEYLGGQM